MEATEEAEASRRSSIRPLNCGNEPPWGVEPQTYALREARHTALGALSALIAAHVPSPSSCPCIAVIGIGRREYRAVSLGRLLYVGQKAGPSGVGVAWWHRFAARSWSVPGLAGGGLGCLEAADEGVDAGGEPFVAVV